MTELFGLLLSLLGTVQSVLSITLASWNAALVKLCKNPPCCCGHEGIRDSYGFLHELPCFFSRRLGKAYQMARRMPPPQPGCGSPQIFCYLTNPYTTATNTHKQPVRNVWGSGCCAQTGRRTHAVCRASCVAIKPLSRFRTA